MAYPVSVIYAVIKPESNEEKIIRFVEITAKRLLNMSEKEREISFQRLKDGAPEVYDWILQVYEDLRDRRG